MKLKTPRVIQVLQTSSESFLIREELSLERIWEEGMCFIVAWPLFAPDMYGYCTREEVGQILGGN